MSQDVPRSRFLWFIGLMTVGCLADLATKEWIFAWPQLRVPGAVWWIWPDHVGFQLSINRGALFGMGQGYVWLFASLSILAALAIPVWLFVFGAARDRLLCTALGLVMGGVLGNLYDRLGLHGIERVNNGAVQREFAVRDWILLQWSDQWRWPNFNLADSLLVCGACLLAWHAMVHSSSPIERAGQTT